MYRREWSTKNASKSGDWRVSLTFSRLLLLLQMTRCRSWPKQNDFAKLTKPSLKAWKGSSAFLVRDCCSFPTLFCRWCWKKSASKAALASNKFSPPSDDRRKWKLLLLGYQFGATRKAVSRRLANGQFCLMMKTRTWTWTKCQISRFLLLLIFFRVFVSFFFPTELCSKCVSFISRNI